MFFDESTRPAMGKFEASETGLTPDLAGCNRLMYEASESWHGLAAKMMKCQHYAIVNEDSQLLSEGVSDFFGKIIEFFKALGRRIAEIFKKFEMLIANAVMGDKSFVDRYRKDLMNVTTTGFKYKGHDFKQLESACAKTISGMGKISGDLNEELMKINHATEDDVKEFREHIEDEDNYDSMRGEMCGESSVSASEYTSKLKEHLIGEAEERESLPESVAAMLETVSNTKKTITNIEKAKATLEKTINTVIKYFEKYANDFTKAKTDPGDVQTHSTATFDDKKVTYAKGEKASYKQEGRTASRDMANLCAQDARKGLNILTTAFGVLIECVKLRRSEYRSILAKLVTHKPKSESYTFVNEGASVLDSF